MDILRTEYDVLGHLGSPRDRDKSLPYDYRTALVRAVERLGYYSEYLVSLGLVIPVLNNPQVPVLVTYQ
jgi:hypothetical protein